MNFVILAVFNFVLIAIGILFAPVLPLLATQRMWWLDNHSVMGIGPVLPKWLNWFMTPDNSLDGDATFQAINGFGYWAKVKWLWRNPAYSFAMCYVGTPYVVTVKGDKTIRDNDGAREGWCFVTVNNLFQWRYVKRIGSTSTCIYINLGWNIMGLVDDNVNPKPELWQATFVCSPRISGFKP